MRNISVLDCTLRDGGYINNFNFGRKAITDIIDGLAQASIDIIETGFMRSGCYDEDRTLFSSVDSIEKYIPVKRKNSLYAAMIQYGAIGLEEIEDFTGKSIDVIRVTFHEHEIDGAFELGRGLMDKGYKVYMQPVGTTAYEDDELIRLIKRVNSLKPGAFYMVDTLGKMYKRDLLRMFYIVDHNLDPRITLGFHSHNNLQMSFANAQELTQVNTSRNLIVDSSVLGMGRGAGNLSTELLIQYLNVNRGLKYDVFRVMGILDQYIKPLSKIYKWGYDAAYYMAAVTGCHPNYASFLLDKQTLHVQDIGTILNGLDAERRNLYDKDYISAEYVRYMSRYVDDTEACESVRNLIGGRKILLLAPGKSLDGAGTGAERISSFAQRENLFTVSINFVPEKIPVSLVFISNMKRFDNTELPSDKGITTVVTSNIKTDRDGVITVNYSSYLAENSFIMDSGGVMAINFLKKAGAKDFLLAGFDGFSADIRENYYEDSLYMDMESERWAKINMAMADKIAQLRKQVNITFLSSSSYEAKHEV